MRAQESKQTACPLTATHMTTRMSMHTCTVVSRLVFVVPWYLVSLQVQEVVANPTSGSVDDSSNNSDAVEKTRRTMTVTFTGTPKYGMIDIARVQDLVDGVAAHAHSCMNPIVKVDNITEDLDVKLRVWCEGCGCVDFFDHFEHKRNDRSQ